MTDATGSEPESERLNPDQRLLDRRQTRDEEEYRAWCEATYGIVEVGQEVFHPADVLDNLAPDAARRGRDEASAQAWTDLEQCVCEQFPVSVAVPFHGFLEGSRQALTRLHRLRDTWESLVRLLAALALSEAAVHASSLKPLVLRDGKGQEWRPGRRRDLLTDRLAVRIGLIEGVLHRASAAGIQLQISALLPMEVLSEVRRLNAVRNGFSHESTKSDAQAEDIISETYPVLRDVLRDLRDLQNVELIRLYGIRPGGIAEVEPLSGHAQSRRIRELVLDAAGLPVVAAATSVDGMSRVLARIGGLMLDLSPFLYAVDDDTGHRTRVLDFKSKKDDNWSFECVADSTTKGSLAVHHQPRLVQVEQLLGLTGDGG